MKTHLVLHVSSEGSPASEIVSRLNTLGFETTLGRYDFYYDWDNKTPTLEDVIKLVDKVIERLKGTQALMHFSTSE